MEDVRRENARKFEEGERKLEALQADIAACEERAQGARAALAEAESAYAEAEKRLAARAVETKALRFLQTPAARVAHGRRPAQRRGTDLRRAHLPGRAPACRFRTIRPWKCSRR